MCYRPFIFYILFSVFAVWTIKTTPAADSLAPVSAFQPKTREAELQEILANRLGIPDPLDGHTINGMPLQKWLIEKKLVNQLFKKTTGSDRMTAGINPYDDSEIGRGYDRIVSYEKWKAVKERITRYATTYLSPSEAETILTRLNAKGMNSTIWAYVKQEYKGRRRSREPADINNMKFIRAQLSMALNAPYKLSYLSSQPLRRLPIFAEQRPGRIAIQENLWIADPGKPSEWQETARSFSQIASVPLPATQSEAEQLLADVTNQQPSLRTGDSPPQYAPRVRRENGHIIVRRFDMDEAGEIAIKDISFNSLWEAVHSTYVREIDSCLETLQMINETITFIERRSQSDETFSESEFQNLPLVSQMAKSPKNERWGKKKQQIHEIVQEAIRGGDATPLKEKMQRIRTAHCDMIRHIRSRIIPELHEFAKRRD
ncbi:MAG: hypothetical protein JW774_01550, partial [Candidatus Aureabacteria bacterium]|nr:hypothetical protein [Candidatus Auribacterota bacterium]